MATATIAAIATTATLLVPCFARASVPTGEKLFETHDCVACHAINHKVVGPSYDAVAKKFSGKPDAVQTLVAAVKKGHVGTWGKVPMPAHPKMPASEIKQIVEWVLSLK